AYESLTAQVRGLSESQHQLRTETGNLARALHSPVTRGRWGEIQLRRVVELAGMIDHCDFTEQVTLGDGESRQRPDLVVQLPGGKHLVIDAKAPLDAYLQSLDAPSDATRIARLQQHAAQIRTHIERLSRKAYWEQFESSPEFVVLFLPGEVFFSAALERDPQLIEFGADRRIILATPTTLIALLRAVFYGWRQEKLAHNAEKISGLGRELFKRLSDMSAHLDRVGRSLNSAVENYNRAAATLESRVFVTARRFQELEAAPADGDLPPLPIVEQAARTLTPPDVPTAIGETRLDAPGTVHEK
ncbi:MAG: DNA recombination protein RmuC, partial [Chthoniobacteraceae bacterium]